MNKFCPRCGGALTAGARFCGACGQAIDQAIYSVISEPLVGPSPPKRNKWLVPTFAGLAAVGLILLALGSAGLLKFRSEPESGVAKASIGPAPGLLEARGGVQSGVTQATVPQNVSMPADVKAWLEHLRQTEERRVKITSDQLIRSYVAMAEVNGLSVEKALLDAMASDDSSAEPKQPKDTLGEDVQIMQSEWTKLTQFFNSMRPPAECMPIWNEYDKALRETGALTSEVVGILGGAIGGKGDATAAIRRLKEIEGVNRARVDQPALAADRLVGELCAKYSTPKWFTIQGDIGGGSLLTKLGGF